MMRFFIPHAEDAAQTDRVEAAVRKFIRDNLGKVSKRRIFQLSYRDKGKQVKSEVGKPSHINGETVIMILYDEPRDLYLVCTATRGVTGGMPILVSGREAGSVDFSESTENSDKDSALAAHLISSISGQLGKLYFGIKCEGCDEALLIFEFPSRKSNVTENEIKDQFRGVMVRCSMCAHVTGVDNRQLFVREIR